MIAKLIVWDENRERALDRLASALSEYEVVGLTTNLDFLGRLARHPAFRAQELDTGFIARHHAALVPPAAAPDREVLALAALAELALLEQQGEAARKRSNDADSPWWQSDGWRLNQDNRHALHFRHGEAEYAVVAHYRDDAYLLELPDGQGGSQTLAAQGQLVNGRLTATLDGYRLGASVVRQADSLTLVRNGSNLTLQPFNPLLAGLAAAESGGGLTAPMPGTVVAVHVGKGDKVEKGTPLVILEAMKMEHTILAPHAGTVAEVFFLKGEQVREGAALLDITAD